MHNSSFEHYNKKFWNRDKKNQTLLNIAQSKLYYSFLNEGKFISNLEFFDYDAWAKYFAIIDLMQAPHGAYPKSVKFYYNTLTGKFEPIGFDAHYVKRKFDKNINKINDQLLYEIYKSNNFPQHQDMVIFLSKILKMKILL